MRRRLIFLFSLSVGLVLASGWIRAEEQVLVIVGQGAADLEHVAAQEMMGQLERLFDAGVMLSDFMPEKHDHLVLVGGPKGNKAVREVAGESWPQLSEQGFTLRSFDANGRRGIIVGGDSPAATLWAVYEFGHRLGVRQLLRDDIYPDKQPVKLTDFNSVVEPELKVRAWQQLGASPLGTAAWPLVDQRKLLKQLAKLKFNRVVLEMQPSQPFTTYEFGGVVKQSAKLWPDEPLSIASDSPGRTAFKGPTEFTNGDFAGKPSAADAVQAGIKHARGVISQAQRLGMSAALLVSPLEFPSEFASALPGLEKSTERPELCLVPGSKLGPDDATLLALAAKQLRSYIESYPTVDVVYLRLPEKLDWEQHAPHAWQELHAGSDKLTLERLLESAPHKDAARAAQSDLSALLFLHKLLSNSELLKRADGKVVSVVVSGIDPVLFPVVDRLLPANTSLLKDSATLPAGDKPGEITLTLSDPRLGVLSQSALQSSEALVSQWREQQFAGFVARTALLAEADPTVYFLSRAAWDSKITVRGAHDDLFVTITGKQSVADRLWLAFGNIEAAAKLTASNAPQFAAPESGMLMKHFTVEPPPAWWTEQTSHYTQAMTELYRSRDGADPRSQPLLYYYAKRSEFVLEYLGAVKAVKEAALARSSGDSDAASTKLEGAVEALYNAIDTLGDVALDPSDRGLIAVLNAYAYKPLVIASEEALNSSQ